MVVSQPRGIQNLEIVFKCEEMGNYGREKILFESSDTVRDYLPRVLPKVAPDQISVGADLRKGMLKICPTPKTTEKMREK